MYTNKREKKTQTIPNERKEENNAKNEKLLQFFSSFFFATRECMKPNFKITFFLRVFETIKYLF